MQLSSVSLPTDFVVSLQPHLERVATLYTVRYLAPILYPAAANGAVFLRRRLDVLAGVPVLGRCAFRRGVHRRPYADRRAGSATGCYRRLETECRRARNSCKALY